MITLLVSNVERASRLWKVEWPLCESSLSNWCFEYPSQGIAWDGHCQHPALLLAQRGLVDWLMMDSGNHLTTLLPYLLLLWDTPKPTVLLTCCCDTARYLQGSKYHPFFVSLCECCAITTNGMHIIMAVYYDLESWRCPSPLMHICSSPDIVGNVLMQVCVCVCVCVYLSIYIQSTEYVCTACMLIYIYTCMSICFYIFS